MSLVAPVGRWLSAVLWAWIPPKVDPATVRDISELRRGVDHGEVKLAASPVNLSLAWFPVSNSPADEDLWAADMGVESAPNESRKEYFDEVRLFREAITTPDSEVPLEPWQRSTDDSELSGAGQRMYAGMNKHALAMENWDRYAIPIRLRGNAVERIWSPRDLGGEPISRAIKADHFVAAVAVKTAMDRFRVMQLEAQRTFLVWLSALALIAHLFR